MKIKLGAGKSEREFCQLSNNHYSIDWKPSPHSSRPNKNTATKADRIQRAQMPNFYRQWGGCTDQALKHGDGSHMASGRQNPAIAVVLADGVAP